MKARGLVAVVGDFNPRNHVATNEALAHVGLLPEWVPTDGVGDEVARRRAGAG